MSTSLAPASVRRGYGCQREVYHPLSKRAEPTALTYYDTSDEEDEGKVQKITKAPSTPVKATPVKATPVKATSMFSGESAITASSTQISTALVIRKSTPKNSPAAGTAKKDTVDRKGKGKEKRPVFLLDEMVAMTFDNTAEPSSSSAPKRHTTAPSTPPRQKRTPFSVLTPENTFGASSPFKTRNTGAGKETGKEKDKENGAWDGYNYGSIPGGFDGW